MYLGLRAAGGNYKAIRKACEEMGIEVKVKDQRAQMANAIAATTRPLSEVLVEGSDYSRTALKKRLIAGKLLEYRCYGDCGVVGTWNNIPISLQLEHINGVHNDNRLENLCLLCPNCHSQTQTYSGKNRSSPNKSRSSTKMGKPNKPKVNKRKYKITWPDSTLLLHRWNTEIREHLAKSLGVSSTAVRRRLVTQGLLHEGSNPSSRTMSAICR